MVVTLRKDGVPLNRAGAFGYAASVDLAHWTWQGELYSPGNMAEPELPSMFKMGHRWYLLGYPNDGQTLGEPTYRVSPNSPALGPCRSPIGSTANTYAPAGQSFDGSQRLLFGWIPRSILPSGSQHWGGHLALPRQLHQFPDGRLAVRLEPSVAKRIRGEAWFPKDGASWFPRPAHGESTQPASRPSIPAGTASCGSSLRPSESICTGRDSPRQQRLRGNRPGAHVQVAGYEIVVDSRFRRLAVMDRDGAVRVQQATGDLEGRKVHLQVLVDDDIVEAFLDDQYSLAARMPESLDSASVELLARGEAGFGNIGLYRLLALEEIGNPGRQRPSAPIRE